MRQVINIFAEMPRRYPDKSIFFLDLHVWNVFGDGGNGADCNYKYMHTVEKIVRRTRK